jgi:predicted sulfurtransferase
MADRQADSAIKISGSHNAGQHEDQDEDHVEGEMIGECSMSQDVAEAGGISDIDGNRGIFDDICDNEDGDPMMISLYYCYTPRPIHDMERHLQLQRDLCLEANITGGRIRVSAEGLNGVLSARYTCLRQYEDRLRQDLLQHYCGGDDDDDHGVPSSSLKLDMKYCKLRPDLDANDQLFDNVSIKATTEVVSLHEWGPDHPLFYEQALKAKPATKKKRGPRRKKNKGTQAPQFIVEEKKSENNDNAEVLPGVGVENNIDGSVTTTNMYDFVPAPHLSPQEWHTKLYAKAVTEQETLDGNASESCLPKSSSTSLPSDAILIDARNVYESKVGYFDVPGVPTLLTNTRKYSSLPQVLEASIPHLAGKEVYMYCTGGVRCERASQYLQNLVQSDKWKGTRHAPPKGVYQLNGGIQRYLEQYGSMDDNNKESIRNSNDATPPKTDDPYDEAGMTGPSSSNSVERDMSAPPHDKHSDDHHKLQCLFRGKNFVFDPRRTDPVIGKGRDSPGTCLMCDAPHDDYDNGHSPSAEREARCCRCRVLILVCNQCRLHHHCWGEDSVQDGKPQVFCGPHGTRCIDEGNKVAAQIVGGVL